MVVLKVLLTNETSEEVKFGTDLQWEQQGAFTVFRDKEGKRVAFNTDCLARFEFFQPWNVHVREEYESAQP